jgi:hypothetical protein
MHPLFDPAGFYRLGTERLVWSEDQGASTIRDFFHARRRQELHEDWVATVPSKPQDWGISPPADQAIHELLKARNEQSQAEAAAAAGAAVRTRGAVRVIAARSDPTPALLVYGLEGAHGQSGQAPVLEPQRRPDSLFTGVDFLNERGETRWGHRISHFEINVPLARLAEEHRCLTLILTRDLLERLGGLLERSETAPDEPEPAIPQPLPRAPRVTLRDESEAVEVIGQALHSDTLAPDEGDPVSLRRAFRLATLLTLAPALTGVTSKKRFQARVELGGECPGLDYWTWVVLCVGPSEPENA